ncbi:MAG: hypothetical protein L0216_02565 [Planctomycetales bacterium]|nr:hypothetical protein [Planctomycetales bacterium]
MAELPGPTKKIDLRAFVADRLAEFVRSPVFITAVQDQVREAVSAALANSPGGGGGAGGDGGVDPAAVKRLVREILAAEVPTREEVEKMIRRVREGSGVRTAPVDAASIRRMIAEAVEANRTDSEEGGGGGASGPPPEALKEQMAQTAREVLAAEAGSLVRTIRKGVDELLAAREARLLESASLRQSVEGVVTAKVQAALAARGRDTGRVAVPKPEAIREAVETVVAELLPKAVAEAVPAAMATAGGSGNVGGGGVDPETLGQMLEAKFREFQTTELPRVLGTFLDQKLPMEMFQNVVTLEDVRREVASARAAGGAAPAGTPPAFSGGKGPADSQVLTRILGSQELKEMLDDKFRLMTTYLKTDLIPKLVKDTMAKGGK